MNRTARLSIRLIACAALLPASAHGVTLQFDYSLDTNGFFNDLARRNVLQAAGDYFSSLITDNLTAITSGPSGFGFNNTLNGEIFDPANPDNTVNLNNLSVAADTLVIYAGGSSNFTGNTLAQGGFGGIDISGTQTFVNNAESRGQIGATRGANAVEFAPWGGAISFNIATQWYFDADTSTNEAFAGFDFFSVALHELGHALGIGTAASWYSKVNGALFTGAASSAENGGSVALSGDLAHWNNGTLSTVNGVSQETAMDPDIAAGQRKRFTDLDLAALTDVGWTLAEPTQEPTPVPVPLAYLGLLGLVLARRAWQASNAAV